MFWSDTNSDRIYRAWINGTGATILIRTDLSNTGIYNEVLDSIIQLLHYFLFIHRGPGMGLDQRKTLLDGFEFKEN